MSLFAEPRVSRDAENLSKETAKDWCQLNSNDECCKPEPLLNSRGSTGSPPPFHSKASIWFSAMPLKYHKYFPESMSTLLISRMIEAWTVTKFSEF